MCSAVALSGWNPCVCQLSFLICSNGKSITHLPGGSENPSRPHADHAQLSSAKPTLLCSAQSFVPVLTPLPKYVSPGPTPQLASTLHASPPAVENGGGGFRAHTLDS